jgi:hypothetical protein
MKSRRRVNSTVMLLRLLLVMLLLTLSCSRAQTSSPSDGQAKAPASPDSKATPTPSPTPNSPIRTVDFENFTYPEIGARGTFTLKGGYEPNVEERRSIVDVVYGDVTADGIDEAMVVHSQSIRGSAIPFFVYVYAMNGTKPKLLWSFYTGDRAQGGLRRVFAQTGHLMLELYGKNEYVGMANYDAGSECAACVEFYTRSRYEWKRDHFQRLERLEVVPANGSASYLSSDEKP